jgi:hypothetical protein
MNGSHFAYALPYRALALSGAATEDRLFRFTGSLAARAAETTSGPVHDGNRPKDCKTYSREVIRRPVWRPDARLIPRCPCSETLRPTHAVHRGEPIQRVPVACREFSRSPFSPLHASPSTPTAPAAIQAARGAGSGSWRVAGHSAGRRATARRRTAGFFARRSLSFGGFRSTTTSDSASTHV